MAVLKTEPTFSVLSFFFFRSTDLLTTKTKSTEITEMLQDPFACESRNPTTITLNRKAPFYVRRGDDLATN
jgi:hypothetical protein